MINATRDGIVAALRREFPAVPRVYDEEVKQGLVRPCFLVACVMSDTAPLPAGKTLWDLRYSVQYIPGDGEKRAECAAVATALPDALRVIGVEGEPVRGWPTPAVHTDEALTVLADYRFHTYHKDTAPPMDSTSVAVRKG